MLKGLKQRYKNLVLGIPITYSGINQKEIDALQTYIEKDLQPDDYGLTLVRGEVKEASSKRIDMLYYENFVKRKNEYMRRKAASPAASFLDTLLMQREKLGCEIILKTKKLGRFITPCYAGRLLAVMYEDGSVFPCEMLCSKIGNIKDFGYSFKKLWVSGKACEIRRKITQSKCFCTYECAMSEHTLFNPRHAFSIGKNTLIKKWQ